MRPLGELEAAVVGAGAMPGEPAGSGVADGHRADALGGAIACSNHEPRWVEVTT